MAGNARESGKSVTSRALAILGAFDVTHRSMSLSDISRRTGIPLATAHRLLGELVAWGALQRTADGRYRIGLRLWELGSLTHARTLLREVALPFLQSLHRATKEDVYLAVADGDDAVCIEYLSARKPGMSAGSCGLREPLSRSAVGLALLAQRKVYAPGLHSRLAEVRRRGCAMMPKADAPGTQYLAMPVAWEDGGEAAAIGLTVTRQAAIELSRETLIATAIGVQRALVRTDSDAEAEPALAAG